MNEMKREDYSIINSYTKYFLVLKLQSFTTTDRQQIVTVAHLNLDSLEPFGATQICAFQQTNLMKVDKHLAKVNKTASSVFFLCSFFFFSDAKHLTEMR